MQQNFERRSNRGRGDPDRGSYTQRGDDRDYERIYDNYGEGSGEYDARQSRAREYRDVERESFSDRERYDQQRRQDRYADEMRGDARTRQDRGEHHRFEQERSGQGRWSGQGNTSSFSSDEGRSMRQRDYGQGRSDQGGYDQRGSGRSTTPYDQGEMSNWYGGDTGMGDTGSSTSGGPSGWSQRDRGQQNQGQFGQRDMGWRESSQRQASSQFGQPRSGQQRYDQDQYRDRFSGTGGRNWSGANQGDWDRSMDAASGNRHSIEGPFTGRGPRGYRRSDERILEDVSELLTRHGEIDASQMEVEVHEAVVILRGTADSGRVRRLTEEVVEDVPGVRDVRNDLRVNQRTGYAEAMPSDMRRADADRSDMGRSETGRSQMDRSEAGRSSMSRTETGRSDWDRPDTGQREMTQGREASQAGLRQGGTIDTSTPAYGTGVANTSGAVQTGAQTQHAQAGGAQIGSRFTIREGMDVVGSDGVIVGQVKETRGTDFLVDRSMQRDVYVPFSAVQTVDNDRVMLNTPARDIDNQNWPTPDLTGASQQRPAGGG